MCPGDTPAVAAGRPATPTVDPVVEVFLRLARRATGDFRIEEILRDLCTAGAELLDVTGAGVAYPDHGRMRFVHATSEPVISAELVQDATATGPCHEAQATGDVVVEADLAARPDRWPRFVPHVLSLGLRSVASVPLTARGQVWGALVVYRSEPGPFSPRQLEIARSLADVAVAYVVMAHDRDAAREAHERVAHSATHDTLTGLPNRVLLYDRLGHALAARERDHRAVAVLFVDLDDFKAVNDTHGHLVGDEVLAEVARRLTRVLRVGDTVSRFAGDEFVVVCEDATPGGGADTVETVAARIHAALREPAVVAGRTVPLGASIGIATAGDDRVTPDALLGAADRAMYRSKTRR